MLLLTGEGWEHAVSVGLNVTLYITGKYDVTESLPLTMSRDFTPSFLLLSNTMSAINE